jgi:pyrroloquinoline quinone biosynthesis protein D
MAMSPLEPRSRPRLAAKARLRWDAREAKYLLLYPERGLLLNDSASAILKLVDGTRTVEEIAAALGAEASVVLELLERLSERGLVET